jgi:type II secretory pathway component GspD/PulD (secretin)
MLTGSVTAAHDLIAFLDTAGSFSESSAVDPVDATGSRPTVAIKRRTKMFKQNDRGVLRLTRGRFLVLTAAAVVPITLAAAMESLPGTSQASGADRADTAICQKMVAKHAPPHRSIYHLDHTPALDVAKTINDLLRGERTQAPELPTVIVPDVLSNSILASGSQEELQEIERMIRQIDRAAPIVVIDVLIAQATRPTGQLHEAGKSVGTAPRKRVLELKTLEKLAKEGTIEERFDELNSRGQLRILSRPHIRTIDKRPAFIKVSSQAAIMDSTATPAGKLSRRQNGQNVGVQVGVTPRVTSDQTVLMEIDVDVSQVRMVASTVAEEAPHGDATAKPSIVTTAAQSTLSVPDGRTVVLGGLTAESDIPHWELIIVLTVRVIQPKD